MIGSVEEFYGAMGMAPSMGRNGASLSLAGRRQSLAAVLSGSWVYDYESCGMLMN